MENSTGKNLARKSWVQGKSGQKSKIKICFIITKGVWGGATKYVYTLATSLPKDKYDVAVICGEGGVLKHKLDNLPIEMDKRIRTYELPNLKRDISIIREIESFCSIFKIIWKENPDVLHLNSPKAAGLGSFTGRLLFVKKIITTVHGWTFNEDRGIFQKALIVFFSWLTMFFSHKTIVISKKEKLQAQKMPFVSDKVVLIKNGVESVKYIDRAIVREALLSRIGRPQDPELNKMLWLGTMSELHRNKGLVYAIKAVAQMKTPVAFFVMGEGDERENLEKSIKENGLQDKIFLIGFVDNASLYLKAFDIFMLTSTKEGLPYTILEAGLASLPVIASSVGGIPDIIKNGVDGILTTKGRVGEIVRALEYMIEKPKEREAMGKKLKEKIEKEFGVDQMIEKTKKLYQ